MSSEEYVWCDDCHEDERNEHDDEALDGYPSVTDKEET